MSRLQRHTSIHEAPSLTVHLQTDLKEFLENDGYYLSKSNASFHIPYILIPLFFQTWHSFLFRFRIGSNPSTSIYSSAWTTPFFPGQDFLHWLIVGIIDWWFIIVPKLTYHNRAYRMPLLIKPPLQQNLNKPPLLSPKVHFLRLFGAIIRKISINCHLKTLKFL